MKFVPNAVSRFGGRAYLKLNAASPTILVVSGVVGFGATAVMAAKAARRAEPVLDDHKKARIQINATTETSEDEQKQVVALYKETTVRLARVYGPTILVGTMSASSILYGHKILKGRHVASLLAYSGLQDQFMDYRGRVARTLGEQAEQDIYNGAHGEWVEDPDHKGEYKLAPIYDGENVPSYLTPWFDERNDNCRIDPISNYLFLKGVQSHANNLLEIRGYVFLNEVLKALGFPETPEGQVAGWLRNSGKGDNFVDFGFMTNSDPKVLDFLEGRTREVRLNFNIDGNIYEMMMDDKYHQLH